MDVERIQKINNLALDLMKQGLASDREAALAQAEGVFQEKDTSEYTEMRETMQGIKEDNRPQPPQRTDELSQDQIQNILQQNSQFLVKKIKEFQEKVNSMENELKHLKTKMNYQKLPTAESVRSQPQDTQEPPTREISPGPAQEKQHNHPRSGDFKQEDVSIEKFFYMGTK